MNVTWYNNKFGRCKIATMSFNPNAHTFRLNRLLLEKLDTPTYLRLGWNSRTKEIYLRKVDDRCRGVRVNKETAGKAGCIKAKAFLTQFGITIPSNHRRLQGIRNVDGQTLAIKVK